MLFKALFQELRITHTKFMYLQCDKYAPHSILENLCKREWVGLYKKNQQS